jgi:hypothetical protein
VTTGPDGTFTACFEWCVCVLFPVLAVLALLLELLAVVVGRDILHIIEAIERRPVPIGLGQSNACQMALFAQGASSFADRDSVACAGRPAPDARRTALIKASLQE